MHRLKILISGLIFLCNSGQAQVVMPTDNLQESIQSLNGNWKFKYIPSLTINSDADFYKSDFKVKNWNEIKVPGHWELQGFAEPHYDRDLKEGTGLYKTKFSITEKWNDKQIMLVLDGVLYNAEIWVNGQLVGSCTSSYNRHMFDVTRFVVVGKENSIDIAVSTRNKGYQFDVNDCWALSGIYRDVSLISVPKTHIKDFDVKTRLVEKGNAQLDVAVQIEKNTPSKSYKKLGLIGKLYSPEGTLVKEFSLKAINFKKHDTLSIAGQLTIENPKLWTAETPWLYNLELTLVENKVEIQKIHQKIGLREINIQNGVLKLNGQAIKLKGVDHHDLDPIVGRAITKDMILKDLQLIQKANINFVRTSHYPPHSKLIELCDSLGLYVMCEVPFGYGDEHLTDATYLDNLLDRARLTINRDKNHPSIIIWSIGNENPLTDITIKTGQYVKKIDNTRPICYPMVGGYFKSNCNEIPDFVDILAPHYLNYKELESFAQTFNRPIIMTEYAHSLGLDFDQTETIMEVMDKYPNIAGGAIWHFHDQGILRKVDKSVDVTKLTKSVWLDSLTHYDNFGNKGADGIVYANRVPQVDYWQLRKVFTPVKTLNDSIVVKPGSQDIKIRILNGYDFNNLSTVTCSWKLTSDNKSIQEGIIAIEGSPKDTITLSLPIHLPAKIDATFYAIELQFFNKEKYQFTEKTFRLWPNKFEKLENSDLVNNGKIETQDNKIVYRAKLGNYIFTIDKSNGKVKIIDETTNKMILEGPFARVGRKMTMSIEAVRESDKSRVSINWNPFILENGAEKVLLRSVSSIECQYKFEREEKHGEFIEGSVIYTVVNGGWIDVNYEFTPVNATAILLEAGISFKVSNDYSEMRWIGNGPYPDYPGKSALNEFGFYHLNSDDIYYQGNHSDVQLLLLTDSNGNGFALNCNGDNIAMERFSEGLMLSHNALVSGKFTKFTKPEFLYKANNVKHYSGSFSIVPLSNKDKPNKFKKLFGDLSIEATPFKPFHYSYDQ